MSLFKLLPIAALGAAGFVGTQAMRKSAEVIDSLSTAATLNVEMSGIADAVAMDYTESQRLPLDNFPEFLRQNMREAKGGNKRDKSKDPWGTAYRLVAVRDGFEVQSAGPDTQWGTKDDLKRHYDLTGIDTLPAQHGVSTAARPSHTPGIQHQAAGTMYPQTPPASRPSAEDTDRKVLEFQMKRAAQGSPMSQYDLSLRFLEGKGVEKDLDAARMWMRKAADGGNARASSHLQTLGWQAEGQ